MLLSVKHANLTYERRKSRCLIVSISITDTVSVKAKLVIKRLLSSFFNERYGGSKIVSMDKVYKDINNLEALSVSISHEVMWHTQHNASRNKGLVSWKDLFVRQSQNTSGSSFHRQRYKSKMEISLKRCILGQCAYRNRKCFRDRFRRTDFLFILFLLKMIKCWSW